MNSIVLRDLLKHKIRKQILKRNKKINHKSLVKSMQIGQKIPFLMKYHKKKLVFLLVMSVITWHYSLHKTVYNWVIGMRSPHHILLGMIVDMPQPPQPTINQLSMHKLSLTEDSKQILTKIYYEGEKYLYFGVGRKFLFEVYKKLGLLETEDEQKMFWQKSQFFKKRNQLASGVSLVEHLSIFQQALKKKKQKHASLTEQSFRQDFIKIFMDTAAEIMNWEKQFNSQRQKQYLKNAPGLSQAKKQTMSDIMKENPQISMNQLEQKLQKMGLRGLNISQRYFYHKCQQVWVSMKQLNIKKRLSHPTINYDLQQKYRLQKQLKQIVQNRQKYGGLAQQDLKQYQLMYQKQLL